MGALGDGVKFSVRSPAFIQNPYPFYRSLRDTDPVHYWDEGYFYYEI